MTGGCRGRGKFGVRRLRGVALNPWNPANLTHIKGRLHAITATIPDIRRVSCSELKRSGAEVKGRPGRKGSALSLRWGETALSVLEDIDHLVASHPFVPFQEIIHGRARFEVFKKSSHRQPGAFKHQGAAHALGYALDRGTR